VLQQPVVLNPVMVIAGNPQLAGKPAPVSAEFEFMPLK